MFSTTKVMTSLLTSLLIFLAIELMGMDRNREAFRKRFLAYKDGKSVGEIYGIPKFEDGRSGKVDWKRWDNAETTPYTIPFIEDKAVTLTNAGRATGARLSTNLLDSLADNAMRAGVPVRTAIGLATKESTLGNPTDDKTAWNQSSAIRKLFNGFYPGTWLHINRGKNIDGNSLINYYKGNLHPGGMKKSTVQEGLEFYKQHPDKYNPGLPGYQKAVEARGNEVMNSPEVLKWYKGWEAKQVKVMRPKPYSLPTIQSTAPKKFGKYADGKLPKYGDGIIPVTTGGTGMPAPLFYGGISKEARPTADALERIANFAPYVGTILDVLEVINGNLAKTPSAVIGAVADVALPGLRTAWKGIKAAKTAVLSAPMLIDKIKNYKLLQKLQKKFVANVAYQGVGTYQDVLDDQGYIKSTKKK